METTVLRSPSSATNTSAPESAAAPSKRRPQGFVSLGLVLALVGAVLVGVLGGGQAAHHMNIEPGGAWLASTGEIVHVNGAAAAADAKVGLSGAGKGSGLEMVERGGAVYAVDRGQHPPRWYRIRAATQRVDGSGSLPKATADIQLVSGSQGAYVIDPTRGIVRRLSASGRPGRAIHLPSPLGPAAVDSTGAVWVPTSRGDVAPVRDGHRDPAVRVSTKGARLVAISIGGRIAILDTRHRRIVELDGLGRPQPPISLGHLDGTFRVPESIETGTVLFVVADPGTSPTMVRVDLARRSVSSPIALETGDPGPVEIAGNRGYIADHTSGDVFEVDLATGMTTRLQTGLSGPGVDITVRSGVAYINDPDTDRAVVIGSDGEPRAVNKSNVVEPRPRQNVTPPPTVPPASLNQPTTPATFGRPPTGNDTGPAPPTARAPSAPTGVTATPAAAATLQVLWTAAVDNGASISSYDVSCTSSDGGRAGTAQTVGTVTRTEVAGLTNGKHYSCAVRANNPRGQGPAGTSPEVVVLSRVPDAPAAPRVTPADRRVNVVITPLTADQAHGSTVDGYVVACRSVAGGAAPQPVSLPAGSTRTSVAGLTNGDDYSCTVTATSSGNPIGQASPASEPAKPFGPPSIVGAEAMVTGDRVIHVAFGTADNGSPVTSCAINGAEASCTGADFGGLQYSTPYTYNITATNAAGESDVVTVSTTTNAAPPPPPPPASVSLGKGPAAQSAQCTDASCAWLAISVDHFPANQTFGVQCFSSLDGEFDTGRGTIVTDVNGHGTSSNDCFFGYPGYTVWVGVNGVSSPQIGW